MTTEAFTPPSPITIATAGPHAIPFPYEAGAVRAAVEDLLTGQMTDLISGTDFTVTPAKDETGGNLTLSGPALTAHTGKKLHITRESGELQGWVGTQGAREKGMERQLDRLTRRLQEVSRLARAAVRIAAPTLKPFVPQPGRAIIFNAQGQPMNGPDATDIAQAQPNAAAAAASASAAAGSVTSAQTAEANAQAWAGSVNSAFLQASSRRCTLGGLPNALTLTTGGSVVSVSAGQRFWAIAQSANTGAAMLQVDELSPAQILTLAGRAVPAGHWEAGQELEFTFDGLAWRVEPAGLYGRVCARVSDLKVGNVNGGASGGIQKRNLNTVNFNAGGFVLGVSSDIVTLARGHYLVEWVSPASSNVLEFVANIAYGQASLGGTLPYYDRGALFRGAANNMQIFSSGEAFIRSGSRSLLSATEDINLFIESSSHASVADTGLGFGKVFTFSPTPDSEFTVVKITPLRP